MTQDANEVDVVYTTNDVYEAEIIRNQLHDTRHQVRAGRCLARRIHRDRRNEAAACAGDADRARKLIERRMTDNFEPPRDEV